MATMRKRLVLDDKWRERIQTGVLLNRLNQNATGAEIMTAGQIKSAEILLRKVLPDLKAIELTGADGGPVEITVVIAPHSETPPAEQP